MGEKRRDGATVEFGETMRLIRMGVTADTHPGEAPTQQTGGCLPGMASSTKRVPS